MFFGGIKSRPNLTKLIYVHHDKYRGLYKGINRWIRPVVSYHIISVATFATIVATRALLSPLLLEFERYAVN
jgi:hypothetical protein